MAVRHGLIVLGAALALAGGGLAQTVVADPRVAKTLEALNWTFKTDADADYNLIMQTENERTQLLIVRSRTFHLGKLEQREIWSAAALVDGEVSPEMARELLSTNLQVKLGFWCTIPQDESRKQLVMYVARVPAECDPETFAEVCQGVAEVADSLEEQTGGQDQY